MSQFIRFPNDGGDEGVWAEFEAAQNYNGIGINSCRLYNDAGALKISVGRIGIDNGTVKGTVVIDAVEAIDISGVSSGNWAKIEMTVSGTGYVFTATDISGGTDFSTMLSSVKAIFEEAKNGFYFEATKRCVGVAWKTAGGNLSRIFTLNNKEEFFNTSLDRERPVSIFTSIVAVNPVTGWTTLTLGDTLKNEIEGVSLSSNQVTLSPGKYYIAASSNVNPSANNSNRGLRIRDITNGVTLIGGNGVNLNALSGHILPLQIEREPVVIEDDLAIELQQYGSSDVASLSGAITDLVARKIIIERIA